MLSRGTILRMIRAASFDTAAMTADLGLLVGAESPSRDVDRLTVHARLVAGMMGSGGKEGVGAACALSAARPRR